MSISVAQSRQQLSALIEAAQSEPQIITKRNTPVAVLVSPEYFQRSETTVKLTQSSFYGQLLHLREIYTPQDDEGLFAEGQTRKSTWYRRNDFVESDAS